MASRNEWNKVDGEKCQKAQFFREVDSSKMLLADNRSPPVLVFAKPANAFVIYPSFVN